MADHRPGDSMRGRVVAVDDDAPPNPSRDRETPSGMLSRAAEEGARRVLAAGLKVGGEYVAAHPRAARVARHMLMIGSALGIGAGGFMVGDISDDGEAQADSPALPVLLTQHAEALSRIDADLKTLRELGECDPLMLRYAMHMAEHGKELEKVLRDSGNVEAADAVKRMTDPNQLPDDLQLCALLERRQAAESGTQ